MRQRSVVLLSGGLDSAANLAFCHDRDLPILAITARYGQRASGAEIRAARSLCQYYGIEHQVLNLEWLGEIGGSSLTDRSQAVPHLKTDELDFLPTIQQTAQAVWVPNRNGLLINAAACFAERSDCKRVVVGFNAEEATTFPDNSVEFLQRSTLALELSTANQVEVFCYTAEWDKRRIVAELRKLSKPFPFERIWSCYFGDSKPCENCESCRRLARALGA